jgi:hypothetical protein
MFACGLHARDHDGRASLLATQACAAHANAQAGVDGMQLFNSLLEEFTHVGEDKHALAFTYPVATESGDDGRFPTAGGQNDNGGQVGAELGKVVFNSGDRERLIGAKLHGQVSSNARSDRAARV